MTCTRSPTRRAASLPEAHDMAIRPACRRGGPSRLHGWRWPENCSAIGARTERLGAVAQILFDHAGASGTVLAWELGQRGTASVGPSHGHIATQNWVLSFAVRRSSRQNGKNRQTRPPESGKSTSIADGKLLGRPVELVCLDDQTNPKLVADIYQRLLDVEKVDVVVGGYGDNSVAPAMPLIMERKRFFLGLMALAVNAKT